MQQFLTYCQAMEGPESRTQLKVADVLGLPPFLETPWETLTPQANLSRPVRWIHAIDDPRPAALLQGQEFVLSTLSRFTEDTVDLLASLRRYVNELVSVEASALAVEVLSDRPRLREALQTLSAELRSNSNEGLPIFLFDRQVRFVDITEHFHRFLVARLIAQESTTESYDPLFEVSTQLIRDVMEGRTDSAEEVSHRAQVMGLAGEASYESLVLRFSTADRLSAAELARAQQLTAQAARTVAARSHVRALVGETPAEDLGILLAMPQQADRSAESQFCLALQHAVEDTRSSGQVPSFVIAAGQSTPSILEAVIELASAQQVLHSLDTVLPRAERFPGLAEDAAVRGFWRASDLGVLGLLARVEDPAAIKWFVSSQLDSLNGPAGPELRELIRALASPTRTKVEVAADLGISRPTLYARMYRLQRLIGRRLNDEVIRALHLALILEDLHS